MTDWWNRTDINEPTDWWLTSPADDWWKSADANVDGPPGRGGGPADPGVFDYLRPASVDRYLRPDGTSLYKRPA